MFTFESWIYPHGIAETDELYVMPYINGGVGECYIIKKDAPDVLYKGWWNLASYGGGSDEKDVFITNTASDKYVIANRFENDRELHPDDDGRRDLKLAVRYYKQTEFDAFIEQGYALPEPAEHYFLLSFETGLVDGAPVCNVTRTEYSLPAQDDAAVIIDNGIEEEASSDEVTIIE